ncbi:putative transcription factor-like [Capsicum annuum]|nr:putative transcription factor-like [Capsicum annuum]
MLIISRDISDLNATKRMLERKLDMKDLEIVDVILGIKIHKTPQGLALSQSHYIEKVLDKFKYLKFGISKTPLYMSYALQKDEGESDSKLDYNPDMQLSQIDCLAVAYNRNEVKKLQNELEELDIKKDIAIARIKHLDKMAETRQKSWWESIEQLSADEVTDFEAWLNATSSKMRQHLNQLENGASTSLG